jgi:hypothetical protein
VLAKYLQQLTKLPGNCTQFVYEIKIEGSMSHNTNSRTTPSALTKKVSQQIQAMLKNGILKVSHPAFINQITLVVSEGRTILNGLDARRINKQIVADSTNIMPMQELLQIFYGVK